MAFANRFGWSFSREASFDECARRYYFHYYLSWGGWSDRAPAIAREAFRLKRLVSLPLWRGQLVHYAASLVLRSMRAKGRVPDRDAVVAWALERFDAQYAFSRDKRYLVEPKKTGNRLNVDWLALFDHEYGRPVAPETLDRCREECVRGIEGLLSSPLLPAIMASDRARWEIEDLERAEFAQAFEIDGVTVYVKTDFIFRGAAGEFCIVDWKTGRAAERAAGADDPGDAAAQLGVYAFWAARAMRVPTGSVRLYEVRLLDGGAFREHAADEGAVEEARRRIEDGIAKLAAVLVNRDTARNEALGPRAFPTIDGGRCRFCNFYRICKDEESPLRLA